MRCFNTQPPEGGWDGLLSRDDLPKVSTHSRPKAAGSVISTKSSGICGFQHTAARRRLAAVAARIGGKRGGFNTQPPEGGWRQQPSRWAKVTSVSTHSRPKAAGHCRPDFCKSSAVSTHSRLKAAVGESGAGKSTLRVSTHSRLKAAAGLSAAWNACL
nr:hypothetical protein [Neisseria mucosa]